MRSIWCGSLTLRRRGLPSRGVEPHELHCLWNHIAFVDGRRPATWDIARRFSLLILPASACRPSGWPAASIWWIWRWNEADAPKDCRPRFFPKPAASSEFLGPLKVGALEGDYVTMQVTSESRHCRARFSSTDPISPPSQT